MAVSASAQRPTDFCIDTDYKTSRQTTHNSQLTIHVSPLTSHVSRLTSHVSRLTSHVSRFTFHVSGLVFIRKLSTRCIYVLSAATSYGDHDSFIAYFFCKP